MALIGTVAAVIGIPVAIATAVLQARAQRRALGCELTDRALVTVGPEARERVQIRYEGVEVTDVHLVQVVVRNTGNAPIRREDFDRPIAIKLPTDAILLPSTLTATSEPDGIDPGATLAENVITIAPVLLNPSDRITAAILVAGTPL